MISVNDILNICSGILFSGKKNIVCKNFTNDTRKINNNFDVYVGIKGENYDGNFFYKEAFNKGVKVCILDNEEVIDKKNDNETIILVEDTVERTEGNMNNHIGVPLTILSLDDHDILVVEMGMNHFNELHALSNIVKPTIAVITNIGTAHIGNLGSRENILKAKLEIIDGMYNGTLIVNNDNDLLRTVKYDNLITIGIENDSDYVAKDIEMKAFSSEFYIDDEYVSLPVGSLAFVYNALFAYAVGRKLGIDKKNIVNSLEKFKLSPHRLEVISENDYTIIDDTYNASLDSVKNSLSLLSKVDGRKVFIFADILEADEFGEKIHQNVADICIENNIDVIICIGALAKTTYNKLKDNNAICYYFESNEEAIKEIDKIVVKNDTILVKGSHSMNLLEIVNYLRNKKNP